jgi:hypothetical protein
MLFERAGIELALVYTITLTEIRIWETVQGLVTRHDQVSVDELIVSSRGAHNPRIRVPIRLASH